MQVATFAHEREYWNKGYTAIVGIDEVGRGSWAGPVVAAGAIFEPECVLGFDVADSKLVLPKKRITLAEKIKSCARAIAIAEVPVDVINSQGIGKATHIAYRNILDQLKSVFDFIFMDAFYIQEVDKQKQLPLIQGDKISASIAAASIVAKVYRDNLMEALDPHYPVYGFAKHKGYGTKEHQAAIKQHGLSTIHRTSFQLEKFCSPGA